MNFADPSGKAAPAAGAVGSGYGSYLGVGVMGVMVKSDGDVVGVGVARTGAVEISDVNGTLEVAGIGVAQSSQIKVSDEQLRELAATLEAVLVNVSVIDTGVIGFDEGFLIAGPEGAAIGMLIGMGVGAAIAIHDIQDHGLQPPAAPAP